MGSCEMKTKCKYVLIRNFGAEIFEHLAFFKKRYEVNGLNAFHVLPAFGYAFGKISRHQKQNFNGYRELSPMYYGMWDVWHALSYFYEIWRAGRLVKRSFACMHKKCNIMVPFW